MFLTNAFLLFNFCFEKILQYPINYRVVSILINVFVHLELILYLKFFYILIDYPIIYVYKDLLLIKQYFLLIQKTSLYYKHIYRIKNKFLFFLKINVVFFVSKRIKRIYYM